MPSESNSPSINLFPFNIASASGDSSASVSSAKEVESYNDKNVYFARSESVRLRSSSTVEYNIGDVVRHTIDDYHGVIVGWDFTCQVCVHGFVSAQ